MASSLSSGSAASSSFTKRLGTPSKGVSLAKKRRAAATIKSKVTLETVLGVTCHSPTSLAGCDTQVAYPAGCVTVLQDLRKKNKKLYLINKKPISCLCISRDGEYLATGEYGREPCARVWGLKEKDLVPCSILKGHAFGVKCMAFTFGHKYLITIGYRYDRQVILWNWKTNTQLMYGKYGQPVNSMAISEDQSNRTGPYFVTAHPRRIQYWYYDLPTAKEGNKKKDAPSVLKARSAILGDLQDNNFLAVACGSGPLSTNTYALSKSGKLLLLDSVRLVDKFTEIKASSAHSLVLSDSYLFCGCSEGVIRLFDPYTLDYIITLPFPHPLGLDISVPVVAGDAETLHYPDAIAMVISSNKLSVVYNDHSFYVWDVSNVKQVGKNRSSLFHSACVWDICTYPFLDDDSKQLLPDSSFVTCSSDNTVRFWCLEPNSDQWNIRNVYSKDLIRVLYNESTDINSLKDQSVLPGDASAVADSSRGVRSIVVHSNGQHLAVGDREGNLRIYDLQFMDKIYEEVAHDAEILCLSYSKEVDGLQFLATASRDRMVHVFTSVENSYQPVQSLPDHSAAVTAIGFTKLEDRLQLLSSGADKSIIFHAMEKNEDDLPVFRRSNHIVSKASIYDMAIDAFEKYFLTAGQDKFIRMYGVATGKKHTVIKVPTSDDAAIIKVTLDPSGLYAAASVGDKSVLIFDIYTGECVTKISGHSEVVTQLKFSRDCKYLYTVSGDSCIFVWRLWAELTKTMHERLAEINHQPLPLLLTPQKMVPTAVVEERDGESVVSKLDVMDGVLTEQEMLMLESEQPDFDFRLSLLPVWARKAAMSRPSVAQQASKGLQRVHSAESGIRMAEGKWAERVAGSELTLASDSQAEDYEMPVEDTRRKKSDSAPMVIDLTGEDTPEGGSPTDSPPKHSSGESDAEGEVLYHPSSSHHLDIDPSIFSVTTPTKPFTHIEDVDEEEESVTPNVSPPMHRPADTHFLEANYQSLEKVEDEEEATKKLQAISSRLSISSRFLRKHSRLHLFPTDSVDFSSPNLVDEELPLTPMDSLASPVLPSPGQGNSDGARMLFPAEQKDLTPADVTITSEDTSSITRDSLGPKSSTATPRPSTCGTSSVRSSVNSVPPPADKRGATAPPPWPLEKNSEKTTSEQASKTIFKQEVSETKKRLLDLGYNIPSKEKSVIDVEEVIDVDEGDDQEPRLKDMGPQVVGSLQATTTATTKSAKGLGIKKAKEIEEGKKFKPYSLHSGGASYDPTCEHGGAKTLCAKAAGAISNLEANFRSLTILNAEAVKANDTNAIATISKGLTAHKVKVVSWSNRNRKSWRKKGKAGTPPNAQESVSMLSKDGTEDTASGAQGLGPREIQEANVLIDQLKKLLSQ